MTNTLKAHPATPKPDAPKKAALVKMVRGPEGPAPHSADVHPAEVDNYAAAGWTKA